MKQPKPIFKFKKDCEECDGSGIEYDKDLEGDYREVDDCPSCSGKGHHIYEAYLERDFPTCNCDKSCNDECECRCHKYGKEHQIPPSFQPYEVKTIEELKSLVFQQVPIVAEFPKVRETECQICKEKMGLWDISEHLKKHHLPSQDRLVIRKIEDK